MPLSPGVDEEEADEEDAEEEDAELDVDGLAEEDTETEVLSSSSSDE